MSKDSPLQSRRFYRVKNPKKKFLCALCTAPREMKYSKNLEGKHFLQIILLASFLAWILFPYVGAKALVSFFPVWLLIELANKLLYRKEIPCPYCGFDATWYRRDVSVAKQKVEDFWQHHHPELVQKNEAEVEISA